MKIYRNSIIACFTICIVSIVLVLVFVLVPCNLEVPLNIIIGVFASAFVVLVTLLIEYHISKHRAISKLLYYSREYLLEFANLIQMLFPNIDRDSYHLKLQDLKLTLSYNSEIFSETTKLINIFETYFLSTEGFYPFLIKNKNNLKIHRLKCYLIELNNTILHLNFIYLQANNVCYRIGDNIEEFTDEKLAERFRDAFSGNNDTLFAKFKKLQNELANKYKRIDENELHLNKCP